jgi:regulation of enolase protein 1 (concanavalin A-like superfamily)
MHLYVTLFAVLLVGAVLFGVQPSGISIKGIPAELQWKNVPESWKVDEQGLQIVAGKNTDWFVSPLDGKVSSNAPLLLFKPDKDFVLSAKLTVELRRQWDAGFLMAYLNDSTWAKFALELSAYQEPTIVTVVTRGASDDCNSSVITGNSIYLQLGKIGRALAFYTSPDGRAWKLVRSFTLGEAESLRVGFASQSPLGEKGTASFSEIRYAATRISDLFKGI